MAQIFISYSRSDRPFLDNFIPLIRRVYGSLWYDDDIHGGADWWQMILDEIGKCDLFVYLISNESLESPYCQAELREALRLNKQILPVVVRRLKPAYPGVAPADLASILSQTQYIDLTNIKDTNAMAQLFASVNRLLKLAPSQQNLPQSSQPIPQPPVPDRKSSNRIPIWPIAAAVMVALALIGILLLTNGDDGDVTDDPTNVAGVGTAFLPSATPTDEPPPTATDDPTATPTDEPTPTATDEPTATPTPDVISAAQTVAAERAAQALLDEATATAARLTQDAALNLTESANLTATATQWTRTPTPDLTASVEAVLRQWADETATLWTDTPTPTNTPTSTPTANATPDPIVLARTPVTRNADWTPVEREFDLPGGGTVTMVLVPAGCFMMGSEDGASDEQPVHQQCFDEPFWIDKYEVTNAQIAAFLNTNGNQSPDGFEYLDADDPDARIASNGGQWVVDAGYADHPAIEVTWFAARDYCAGRGGSLPTEAEWEYAARGPDGLVYPWGDEFVAEYVVYSSNSGGETAAVGSGERAGGRSWVGVHDLSGNVWEWVSSLYEEYPYGDNHESNTNTINFRELRGGSWYGTADLLRAASRGGDGPVDTGNGGGFRCARS